MPLQVGAAGLVPGKLPGACQGGAAVALLAVIVLQGLVRAVGDAIGEEAVAHVHAGTVIKAASQLPGFGGVAGQQGGGIVWQYEGVFFRLFATGA